MQSKTISVVIPIYNSGATIAEALDSVFCQNCPVHEIIVVDDLSTDSSIAVVKQWHLNHPDAPLLLIESIKNGGPAVARNRGIKVASGGWIAFLDADDAWLPSKLSIQFDSLSDISDAALICGATIPLDPQRQTESSEGCLSNTKDCKSAAGLRILTLADFVAHNPIATSTVIVKREVLLASSGFDEQFCGPEDYDLWLRLVSEYKCLELDISLSRYRHTVGSLSMDEQKFLPQVLRVLAKAFREGGALYEHQEYRRRAHAEQYFSASWMAYNRGAKWTALRLLLVSWGYDVRRLHKEQKDPGLRLKLLLRYLFHHH